MDGRLDNPWAALPEYPPYVLDIDRPYVDEWNQYVGKSKLNFRLHTEMVPDPFTGPSDAPLLLLNRNPGVGSTDEAQHSTPLFRQSFRRSIVEGTDRHMYLTPEFEDTDGGKWMRRCVSGLARAGVEIDRISRSTMSMDFHGYHSTNWTPLPTTLPSQWYGFQLVREAMARGAVVVVFRGVRDWFVAVPGLARYDRLVVGANPQVASISPRNLGAKGFESILAAVS